MTFFKVYTHTHTDFFFFLFWNPQERVERK